MLGKFLRMTTADEPFRPRYSLPLAMPGSAMPDALLTLLLPDETATARLGAALGEALLGLEDEIAATGIAVWLRGELGAGKTTLVRGLLRRAGITGPVKSPTYTLLEPYEVSRLHLYHFDFYRFKTPREFADAGFSEYFGPGNICLVEWPEQAGAYLPPADVQVALHAPGTGRRAQIGANTEIGCACRDRLETFLRPAGAGA
jgi:tRNA threonylcarbamoyladenosine biosynthesis protein TsaE